MSRLLKILRGVNAGEEIALADGPVSFGSGETCDIVIADATIPACAFVLDSSADALSLRMPPDGEARTLEPYTVFSCGEMEFAVGEDVAPWPELRRVPGAARPREPDRGTRPIGLFARTIALAVIALALLFCVLPWRGRWHGQVRAQSVRVPTESLERIAADAGLELEESDGRRTLSGNFVRRVDRLAVAARAYAADREVMLDLSDDETLRSAVDEMLFLLTEGRITAMTATNRCVRLGGTAKSRQELLDTVAALCADVNRLKTVDDTAVVCADGLATSGPTAYRPLAEKSSHPFVPKSAHGAERPDCPVAGVIVAPYPCLVMRDGSRATEGAEIAGWSVVRISSDGVMLRRGAKECVWKP